MSDLVVIGFDNEHTAFEMRAELVKLQKEYLIDMEDVVVVNKDDKGKVKLHQAMNLTATGAVGGSFWGMLVGMIFLNPLVGAAVGAGAGETVLILDEGNGARQVVAVPQAPIRAVIVGIVDELLVDGEVHEVA